MTLSDDAVKLAVPPQVVLAGPTTVTPAGMASLKLKPEIADAFRLARVIVNVLDPPATIPASPMAEKTAAYSRVRDRAVMALEGASGRSAATGPLLLC